jgi:hypothetical protein
MLFQVSHCCQMNGAEFGFRLFTSTTDWALVDRSTNRQGWNARESG